MAAPYSPVIKNEDYVIRIALRDASHPRSFKITPTIAAGDFQVTTDAGGFGNLGTIPAVSPAATCSVLLTLSAAEMNGDVITVRGVDQTNPKEWNDYFLSIATQSPVMEQGVVEGTITLKQAVALFLSVLTGKSSGGGTATVVFRDTGDSKNRLSVTVDADGNRTAVGTRDGT